MNADYTDAVEKLQEADAVNGDALNTVLDGLAEAPSSLDDLDLGLEVP